MEEIIKKGKSFSSMFIGLFVVLFLFFIFFIYTLVLVTDKEDDSNEKIIIQSDIRENNSELSNTSLIELEDSSSFQEEVAGIIYLGVNETLVKHQDTIKIEWVARNVEKCVASGFWSGDVPSEGSQSVVATVENQEATLTCYTTDGEEIQSSVNITVEGPEIKHFLVVDYDRESFESVTLGWNTSETSYCEGKGAWSGRKSVSGVEIIDGFEPNPENFDKTYQLICYGIKEQITDTASINLLEEAEKANVLD